jgi:hypothetical protein
MTESALTDSKVLHQFISKMRHDDKMAIFEKLETELFPGDVTSTHHKYQYVAFTLCSGGSELPGLLKQLYEKIAKKYREMSCQIMYVVCEDQGAEGESDKGSYSEEEDEKKECGGMKIPPKTEHEIVEDGKRVKFDCVRKPIIAETRTWEYNGKTESHDVWKFSDTFIEHPEAREVYEVLKEHFKGESSYMVARVCEIGDDLFDYPDQSQYVLIDHEETYIPSATMKEIDRVHRALLSTRYCENTGRYPEHGSRKFSVTIKGKECNVLERWTECEGGM